MIGLDLGARHIEYCEVRDGKVVDRTTVKEFRQLKSKLGPGTEPARVAFEACREGWHVHDKLAEWGHEPLMLDTTRIRQIGVGQHKRKNDAIDAEAIAVAVDAGRIPLAHVLSQPRRELRALLSIREALVQTRVNLVVTIRGLLRAKGIALPQCQTCNFARRLSEESLPDEFKRQVAPLVEVLNALETQMLETEQQLLSLAEQDPMIRLCATVPGVSLIVGATFLSVIDNADRFKNADAVASYLGLVPSESTTGGPSKRRLGSITKQGNSHARATLVQAAWQIFRKSAPNNSLWIWSHQVAEKRTKFVAIVALARKLACVMWAMCRDGTVFDAEMSANQSAQGQRRAAEVQRRRAEALERAGEKLGTSVRKAQRRHAADLDKALPKTKKPTVPSARRIKKTQEVAI